MDLTLADRLRVWGYKQGKCDENGRPYGWCFSWDIWETEGANYGKVSARLGPVTGYGWTSNQALNSLADGLVEEGWTDDRDDCSLCEGDGEVYEGFELGSTLVRCPDCDGIGRVADEFHSAFRRERN